MSPAAARAGRLLFSTALVAALALALVKQRHALQDSLDQVSPLALAGALVALGVGLVLSMLSWRAVLAERGSPLPVRQAGRIFFVGQIGKYVPGSVWPLLTQATMGKRVGVPRTRMVTAGLVALAMSVATGLVTGLLCVGTLLEHQGRVYLIALLVLLPFALAGLHPKVLNALLARALKLARRAPLEQPLSTRGVLVPVALLLGCWAMFGVQAWLLVRDIGGDDLSALALAVGSFALASTLGTLFIIAPAGAGVREAVLVLGLAPVLSGGQALTVAVLSRLVATVADGLAAGLALLAARRGGALAPAAEDSEAEV
ncbi:MAG: hypothetical protein JWM40_2319 [Frankiales bacterium]|nr:hypothetical protein [Frankiales bacterium]